MNQKGMEMFVNRVTVAIDICAEEGIFQNSTCGLMSPEALYPVFYIV